jgi:hypothetical protein
LSKSLPFAWGKRAADSTRAKEASLKSSKEILKTMAQQKNLLLSRFKEVRPL